jgi:parallel beta-helix repeat protein
MRAIHVILPLFLVLVFSSVSFAASCGGATACNCSDTLNESYTMTSDLTGCTGNGLTINIGVTLDCNGNAITGSGSGYGITAGGSSIVKNCEVSGFERGINLGYTSSATLVNNEVHNNTAYGIYSFGPWGAVINDTHLYDNGDDFYVYVGSTDGPMTLNDITFDNDAGNLVNASTLDVYFPQAAPVTDNVAVMDHSSSGGGPFAPEGYTSFGNRYVKINSSWGESFFSSFNWTWGEGESDAGVKLFRKNSSGNWSEVNSTLDIGINRLNVTNHTIAYSTSYIYGLFGQPGYIPIESCQEINESGTYAVTRDISGSSNVSAGGCPDACIAITAPNVILNLAGHTVEVNDSDVCGVAIESEGTVEIINEEIGAAAGTPALTPGMIAAAAAASAAVGIAVATSDNTTVNGSEPIMVCGFETGILVNNSNNTMIDDFIACNNTKYGIHVLDSTNTTINNTRTYNNALDLLVNNTLGSAVTLNITSLRLFNPAWDDRNVTEVRLYDSVTAGTSYSINWTPAPGPPGGYTTFDNKFIDISGTGPIDTISWAWTDDEILFGGYLESELSLWLWNGTWSLLNNTPDLVNNLLSLANLNPASSYGILHNGTPGTPATLYGANVSNVSHHTRYLGTSAGNLTTQGGNITAVNANTSQLTERWAAFYGNVTGGILLTDATSSNYVYSWSWSPADGGVVCVSLNASLGSFLAIPALGSDIDFAWGLASSATDSGTNTFNSTTCTLDIGGTAVANASYADTGAAGGFITCAAKTAPAPVKAQMIFCSEIISGGTTWNNATGDYEIIAPTPEGPATTETYYFYANLN